VKKGGSGDDGLPWNSDRWLMMPRGNKSFKKMGGRGSTKNILEMASTSVLFCPYEFQGGGVFLGNGTNIP